MALFKVLRGSSSALANQPFHDGYAYFTPDDGRFYIDVQLDTRPDYYYATGLENGKNIYRIEIESKTWAELQNTKSPIGHHHRMSDIDDGVQGIYYVAGTQTAKTGSWTGTLSTVSQLYDGLTIAYYLPFAGSGAATLTLQLSSGTTSAIPVYYTNTVRATTHYGAGSVIVLTYADNAWRRADYDSGNTIPATYCSTSATASAKEGSHTYYVLRPNSYNLVTLRYANTYSGALTLNINSTGAKPIFIDGVPSGPLNYTLPAGTYLTFYDGTNYYFETTNKIRANITGDAVTVGGFTVGTNVPGNAKFTDTTYTFDSSTGLVTNGTAISIGTVPVSHGGTGVTTITSGQVLIGNGTSAITTRGIDTTSGGTANSASLITSGAVQAGLSAMSPLSHKHTVSDITDLKFDGTYNQNTNKVATVSTVQNAVSAIDAASIGLSRALKFIGFSTTDIIDGQTTAPTVSGYTVYSPAIGDVVIDQNSSYEYVYTSANKWERLGPDGSYVVVGTRINYTPEGTISTATTGTVNYTPAGTINAQTFHGTKGSIEVTGTASGSVTIATATSGTTNYTPAGTVTASFTGTATTFSIEGSTTGIAVESITYTPAGTITATATTTNWTYKPSGSVTINGQPSSIAATGVPSGSVAISTATTGTVNYTPSGSVTSTFTGTKGTVTVSGSTTGVAVSFTPAGSISTATTGTVNYTPEGTVTSTFVGNEDEFYGTITPSGSISAPTITVSTSTVSVAQITSWNAGLMYATSVSNEVLVIVDGAAPTLTYANKTVLTGATASASKPTFTGTATTVAVKVTPTGSVTSLFTGVGRRLVFTGSKGNGTVQQGTVNASGTFTPSGTVSSTFTGSGAVLKATFTGSSITAVANWPSLSATFVGDGAKLAFTGTAKTLSFTTQQGTVTGHGTVKPSGTISATFNGTPVRLTGTFAGNNNTFTGSFTPTGTIDQATFSGTGARLVFNGKQASIQIG